MVCVLIRFHLLFVKVTSPLTLQVMFFQFWFWHRLWLPRLQPHLKLVSWLLICQTFHQSQNSSLLWSKSLLVFFRLWHLLLRRPLWLNTTWWVLPSISLFPLTRRIQLVTTLPLTPAPVLFTHPRCRHHILLVVLEDQYLLQLEQFHLSQLSLTR